MKIDLQQDLSLANEQSIEVLIKYHTMHNEVTRLQNMIQKTTATFECMLQGVKKKINIADIYYFEAVDKKSFVYCANQIYTTDLRVYQIAEKMQPYDFVQISKSCVLNINKLASVTSLINRRTKVTLDNGENLIVTRKYFESIKEALEIGGLS